MYTQIVIRPQRAIPAGRDGIKASDLIKEVPLIFSPCPDDRDFHFYPGGKEKMETRIAVIAIIVEDRESTAAMNEVLHQYGEYIIGRMGIPYRQKGISLISVAIDAPNEIISALTGKLGNIPGLTAKAAYSKA